MAQTKTTPGTPIAKRTRKKRTKGTVDLHHGHGVYRASTGHIVLNPNAPWTQIFNRVYGKRTVAKKPRKKREDYFLKAGRKVNWYKA